MKRDRKAVKIQRTVWHLRHHFWNKLDEFGEGGWEGCFCKLIIRRKLRDLWLWGYNGEERGCIFYKRTFILQAHFFRKVIFDWKHGSLFVARERVGDEKIFLVTMFTFVGVGGYDDIVSQIDRDDWNYLYSVKFLFGMINKRCWLDNFIVLFVTINEISYFCMIRNVTCISLNYRVDFALKIKSRKRIFSGSIWF